MKPLLSVLFACLLSLSFQSLSATDMTNPPRANPDSQPALQCVAFSPYVGQLTPRYGPQPSPELIDNLLDQIVAQTPFRCIMTYGVMDGLQHTFAAARDRQLKVIAIVWLDNDIEMNSRSIVAGINAARAYPETIVKLSCGSEVRTRHGTRYDGEILRCIDALREAGVSQPITTIDTWWEWCDRKKVCQPNLFTDKVDWIGSNIFPWWENKFSGVHPCTTAEQAADFHIARLSELRQTYPDKEIVVTEFGWPNGPDGEREVNAETGQSCGSAGRDHQQTVVRATFEQLAARNWSGVVFEAFDESWKPGSEGSFGAHWGICRGKPPYQCEPWLLEQPN